MTLTKTLKTTLTLALCIALAMALSACSKGYDAEYGNNSDGASQINIKNETGSSISALEFTTDATVSDISNSIIDSSSTWENGKTARISYSDAGLAAILFTADAKTYVMHNVSISGVEKATLKLEGEYAYLEFEKDGKTVSTLDDEKAYVKAQQEKKEAEEKAKAEAEQKAKEEEEAKKKAEEEASAAKAAEEAAAAQAQATQSYSYSSGSTGSSSGSSSSSSSSSGSSSSSSGSVQQSTDGCLPPLG